MISTIIAGTVAAVVGLGFLGLAAAALFWGVRSTVSRENAPMLTLEGRLAAVEVQILALPSLWEEERKRAKRSQDSARKARESAEEKLALIADWEESGGDVREVDENGEQELVMQPMLPRLGSPAAPDRAEKIAAVAHLLR